MDRELNEQVMVERVELIARLTVEGASQERDREIALNLIAEIARGNLIKNDTFSVAFSSEQSEDKCKRGGDVKVNITLDKEQQIAQTVVDAFRNELIRRIQSIFPSSCVTVKKGVMTGVELMGVDTESERERLDSILQEVWEDESWR